MIEAYMRDMGPIVANGKTKGFFESKKDPFTAYAQSKDIVTWGDQYSLQMPGKGEWSTTVNHNMFEIFRKAGLPIAYLGRAGKRTFTSELCDMFPYEVVACCIVDGKSSYRKRHPELPAGTMFTEPAIQFHLKTSGRQYRGRELPCDDPLMVFGPKEVKIYLPSKPIAAQEPIFTVPNSEAPEMFPGFENIAEITLLTRHAARLVRKIFERKGGEFSDGKWEYGRARRPSLSGKTLVADVFDADSMRATVDGQRIDKQPIRNGGKEAAPEQIAAYLRAVEFTNSLVQ